MLSGQPGGKDRWNPDLTGAVMKWRGSTTGVLLICSTIAACLVGAGMIAASNITPPDQVHDQNLTGPVVKRGQYDQLDRGMEYEQVTRALGREGTLKSSCTIELKSGQQVETNLYIYENADGSSCMLMFQDQILRVKTQSGLQ